MSCNTCGKSFYILRKEHGCPGCGFSFCCNCLTNKVFLPKMNAEAKVCMKCSNKTNTTTPREPPETFLKRLESLENPPRPPITVYEQDKYQKLKSGLSAEYQQIVDRLRQLKEKPAEPNDVEKQIVDRLNKLRAVDETPSTEDVRARLAKLKGESSKSTAVTLPPPDLRSDQEKSEEIIRQYMAELDIDSRHKESFDSRINDIESRLYALTGIKSSTAKHSVDSDSENEDEVVDRIVEKINAESILESKNTEMELTPASEARADTSELPWCEICNEDATLRCLGCRYLFCNTCFNEHKDDDDECNRSEPYKKPTKSSI